MKLFFVLALAVASASAASLNLLETPAFPTGRIINGQEAQKGEAPYIVSFKKGSHFCGGSIIDEHWILTAAHCLVYPQFDVVAGLYKRNDESDVQIRKATKQIQHEKYGGGVGPYDIGLVYVAEPFNLNALTRDGVAPVAKIAMPSGKFSTVGEGYLYGWGRDNSNQIPNTLQVLNADIIGYTECKKALPFLAPIHETNICSYSAGKTDGACNGDSGGPLVRKTRVGIEQVGIVSWGYTPCQTTIKPSIYTAVQPYIQWIEGKINSFKVADYPY